MLSWRCVVIENWEVQMSDGSGGEVLGGSGKDSLSSSGSIFRRWYSENPPEDVVLSGFVRDLM